MNYILDDHQNPVIEPDVLKWAQWFETHQKHVAEDFVGPYRVSTVFLGIDHNWLGGPPILWETMIFGGDWAGEYQERYSSRSLALEGHQRAVEHAKQLLG